MQPPPTFRPAKPPATTTDGKAARAAFVLALFGAAVTIAVLVNLT